MLNNIVSLKSVTQGH